ncbi:tryptophan synthase subunit alpha [Leptolyngbya cf. ectocarpi LEGE 11479]|uniref:Tryptophan synthase alpha chain n=1 Tax=Leptolyngbya cf. ectocarpi LEGE 11479 TaxID=1828722 RepID=A0A929FBV2_LEPEC|nr:tryptophan synthase subunit alpha [Leptolyngbya ectocarpi]MBE9068978.1 tryptophan synthase subunit alpha [Leptolyngbya cf. ectocarpi LEGE 11479]
MHLEQFIRQQRQQKDILLMSHTVLGYPSWDDNRRAISALVKAGVELIELQFPFSEPIADGPILLAANHTAVRAGVSVQACFNFAAEITQQYPQTRFVIMTYVNILFQYGISKFVKIAAQSGIAGCIIPDLPLEQAKNYIDRCRDQSLATIFLITPENSLQRIQQILQHTSGLAYCVARKGVTGQQTQLAQLSHQYLDRVRSASQLPIAVGFGIQSAAAVCNLIGYADVAVIGSYAVKYYDDCGAHDLGQFIQGLRPD